MPCWIEVFSCCSWLVLIANINPVVSQAKLQNPFCFSNISHLTVVLCAFYHIHTVGNFTIETLVYFPFLLVYSKWFCFFYIRAGCAVISTFPHTSLGPFWIRFRFCWYFSSYKMVLYILLPPKCCKRWLLKYLTEVGVLADHRSPVPGLYVLYWWQPWVIGQGKYWPFHCLTSDYSR